jgi:hypothetical protein
MKEWDLYQWKGLIVGLGCICVIMLGLEIAKYGGLKEFFKNIFKRRGK